MNHLELFSGTHSFGKVSHKLGNHVISVDRDLTGKCPFTDYDNTDNHIMDDIMTWDYKIFPPYYFDIITASPVCLWWSRLRNTWVGRKLKAHGDTIITKEILQQDIDKFGKPMVDKVFEIIEYFKPKFWLMENPESGKMKHYVAEQYPQYNTYQDISYCKFCDWGYKKDTRFWNNINGLHDIRCNKDCDNIIIVKNQKLHKERMGTSKTIIDNGVTIRCNTKKLREKYKDFENIQTKKKHNKLIHDVGGGTNRLERYRIPEKLIAHIFSKLE